MRIAAGEVKATWQTGGNAVIGKQGGHGGRGTTGEGAGKGTITSAAAAALLRAYTRARQVNRINRVHIDRNASGSASAYPTLALFSRRIICIMPTRALFGLFQGPQTLPAGRGDKVSSGNQSGPGMGGNRDVTGMRWRAGRSSPSHTRRHLFFPCSPHLPRVPVYPRHPCIPLPRPACVS